jgi:transcriptional regulator with XRE-family HTH domain
VDLLGGNMALDTIRNLVSDKEPTPNKFTIAMGELIRKAREESGLSQADLAQIIYRRRATLSDIENGKTEVSSGTLVLLAAALEKPITYCYPSFLYRELKPEDFTQLEQEALLAFRNIWSDHFRIMAIQFLQTIAKFDPQEMLIDSFDIISAKIQQEGRVKEFAETKNKRQGK